MPDTDTPRLSRLTAILLQLQAKRLVTASALAEKFGVSIRTIYRDIRALEASGVPVLTEEGRGYRLMEGYRMPPVSFTEAEANALITAEQLVLKDKDASFVRDYQDAVSKIRAVLRSGAREGAELLSGRIAVSENRARERNSSHLSTIQLALTSFRLLDIAYQKKSDSEPALRTVEPFALLNGAEVWMMVAWCRLRGDFRMFRLDRIRQLRIRQEVFSPHTLTLEDYLNLVTKPGEPLT